MKGGRKNVDCGNNSGAGGGSCIFDKELYEKGDIVKQGDKYVLTVTLEFNTPSGASDFVLGGSTNGWAEWKNKDGKTLDEIYRK